MANLHQLLKIMVEKGASDLHITVGSPPQLRIDGSLVPLKTAPLNGTDTRQLCYSVLTDSQKQKFETNNELDLSFGVKGLSRFRGNVFVQRGAVAGVFRTIPFEILSFEKLGLPPAVAAFSDKPRGLILVTGATGSGKSTTLAAMIDAMKYEAPGSVYSVALAPVLAAAANEAIQIMHAEPERVARLHARGSFFLDVAKSLGLDTGASVGSSITPIMVGSSPLAAAASKVLLEEGINALPIAFPGVPMNQARLRFFITSEHTEDQIRHSLTTTAEILSRLREGPLQDLMKSLSNTF